MRICPVLTFSFLNICKWIFILEALFRPSAVGYKFAAEARKAKPSTSAEPTEYIATYNTGQF
jgi:hypothetical protein